MINIRYCQLLNWQLVIRTQPHRTLLLALILCLLLCEYIIGYHNQDYSTIFTNNKNLYHSVKLINQANRVYSNRIAAHKHQQQTPPPPPPRQLRQARPQRFLLQLTIRRFVLRHNRDKLANHSNQLANRRAEGMPNQRESPQIQMQKTKRLALLHRM